MQATVIDISDQSIYLEIDRQLRFESRYISASPMARITRSSKISFELLHNDGVPTVVVYGVELPS